MVSNSGIATQPTPSWGVVYISTGKYLQEACISANSLKQCMPGIHVTVFSDNEPPADLFDHWIKIEDPVNSTRDKVIQLKNTPYQKTLYLDSDTYVAEPLDDLFEMLDDYDFLGALSVSRGYWYKDEIGVPKTFPEINGGVLAFRKTAPVMHMLTQWDEEIEKSITWQKKYGTRVWDQPSLRKLLWQARLKMKLGILPTEYNLLSTWGSFLFGDPVIIHTRNKPKRMVDRTRRHRLQSRVWLGQIGCVCSPYDMTFTELFVFWARIQAVFMLALWQHLFTRKNKRLSKIPEG